MRAAYRYLRRNPSLALVDELAHTNAPGSEHEKRWQDISDLLDAGRSGRRNGAALVQDFQLSDYRPGRLYVNSPI